MNLLTASARFLTTSETVSYLKENPRYAADLYVKKTNAPRDLADKVVAQIGWQPGGKGSGQDLVDVAANIWRYIKETGVVPSNIDLKVEDAVDVRFLP